MKYSATFWDTVPPSPPPSAEEDDEEEEEEVVFFFFFPRLIKSALWYVVPPIKMEATPDEAQIKSLEDIFQRDAKCFNAPTT
jgi:hypothetical protein